MAETMEALVQARCDAKGWTLIDFAATAGISTSGLRKLLRGQVETVRSPTVAGLAKALGTSAAKVRAAIAASRDAAG